MPEKNIFALVKVKRTGRKSVHNKFTRLIKVKRTGRKKGPYVLSGGPLIFNVILFKRKAVYTEGAGPVCKCTGQCTLEGSILLF